jgi:virulence-associated protein VagC
MVSITDAVMPPPSKNSKKGTARRNRPLRPTPVRVAEPASPYQPAEPAPARAKLFANGRSQAVRLPMEFRMPGSEVLVRREGNRIILEPVGDEAVDNNGWPIGFFAELRAAAAHVEAPVIEPLPVHFLTPEEIDPTIAWRK